MDDRFLIAFHHSGTPEEIQAWLDARGIGTWLTRVLTTIPKDEDDWFPDFNDCVVSIRVEWDRPEDEVRHGQALRRHIAELNPDASDEAELFGFNPIEYAHFGTCTEPVIDMTLGTDFSIRTGPASADAG